MRPLSPPTVPPPIRLPACDHDDAHADCGCGCGGTGGCGDKASGAWKAIASCPWWVWLIAFGVVVYASGNEEAKDAFFGPKVRRARRRAR